MLNFNNQAATVNPQVSALLTLLSGVNNGLDPFDPIGSIVRYNNNPGANPYGLAPTGREMITYAPTNPIPGQYVNPYGGTNPFYNPNTTLSPVEYDMFDPTQANSKEEIMRILGITAPMEPISKLDRMVRPNLMPTPKNINMTAPLPQAATSRLQMMQQTPQTSMQPIKQAPINYNQAQGNMYQPYEPYKRF